MKAASSRPAMAAGEAQAQPKQQQPWEYSLRKYLLLLATLVVTVTYAAGFNPPGGIWQSSGGGHDGGRLAGDPIIRDTDYARYLAFFYCNATAFAASLVLIVLILILAVRHDKEKKRKNKDAVWVASDVVALRIVMVVDLLSLMGAYGAGTCRDTVSSVYSAVLVAAVFLYIVVLKLLSWWFPDTSSDSGSSSGGATPVHKPDSGSGGGILIPVPDSAVIPAPVPDSDPVGVQEEVERLRKAKKKLKAEERLRKVLMLLATFAVSVTYIAGLSTPGGFWDAAGDGHGPGDAILNDHHGARLTVFLLCNTTAFVASLLITVLLIIDKKLREKTARSRELYGCIVVALLGLVGAYAAGSCRETDTTVYVLGLVGAVLAFILLLHGFFYTSPSEWLCCSCSRPKRTEENQHTDDDLSTREALDKARSLVLLLATLAATITYAAGLDPPGGLWQDNSGGHMAGDPILLTTNARRFKVFFYCNSVAFVASLVAIILVQKKRLVKHHVLEAAMILDLFGLIGAYAAGSCRDVNTSINAMALAGAVLVYVVIHVVFFTLDHKDGDNKKDDEELLEKRRKRLLLFAILAATITYQAGLTPPGGFLLQDDKLSGHHAGDPVLLYNFPCRYKAFFYCNSVSFMLSIALIILLVNPNLYRPAIRSNALSVCTAVGLFGLMGGYAAGSTQHFKTSIYIFVLVAVVLLVAAGLLLVFLVRELEKKCSSAAAVPVSVSAPSIEQGLEEPPKEEAKGEEERKKEQEEKKKERKERKKHARRKYLMLLGILVASVTYQAGLKPPGGAWQSSVDGYEAGNPVMHDNRRPRYLTFFYSNSTSFVASIVVIIMLLPQWLPKEREEEWEEWSLRVMYTTIVLDLVALLGAYAAGSNRGWKTSVYVVALILAVLGYFVIHTMLSLWSDRRRRRRCESREIPPAPV
ncbi:uncharacterized protein LOC100828510 [Brachypodium distachyon]|uniref:PGG domain-containing protein n=1 Tax=Brachypodium distachyon TaxID=15368 RepID=A0A0Q3I3U6_BRADI|nr:uncharacterized protein LOC100828510 [Brachypodium distachyon]KQJ95251.1 hypothetical protein BRADI_3g16060v3 [Brachypodium distachyon]|eukprot:XP_003573436.1 uncharacterized protein LOC100828510 [Brachypodium distachyon]